MKKVTSTLTSLVSKLAQPQNIRIMMFLLPLIIGVGFGGDTIMEVGGNMGGCGAG